MPMLIYATFTLLAGMVDDFRSRKVHNALVIILFALALGVSFYFRGLDGSAIGLLGFTGALLATIPLFMLGILGGGDVKLFAVFAYCVEPMAMVWTLLYSILWGAFFGVVRAALHKQLLTMVRVTYKVASRQRVETQEIHKIPYTFALILGWFTQLTLMHAAGVL